MLSLKELAAWKAEIDLAEPARLTELDRIFRDKHIAHQREMWKWAQLMNRAHDRFLVSGLKDRQKHESDH